MYMITDAHWVTVITYIRESLIYTRAQTQMAIINIKRLSIFVSVQEKHTGKRIMAG